MRFGYGLIGWAALTLITSCAADTNSTDLSKDPDVGVSAEALGQTTYFGYTATNLDMLPTNSGDAVEVDSSGQPVDILLYALPDIRVLAVKMNNLNDYSVPVEYFLSADCGGNLFDASGDGVIPAHGTDTWKSTPCPPGWGLPDRVQIDLTFFP